VFEKLLTAGVKWADWHVSIAWNTMCLDWPRKTSLRILRRGRGPAHDPRRGGQAGWAPAVIRVQLEIGWVDDNSKTRGVVIARRALDNDRQQQRLVHWVASGQRLRM
jgi:hypothetical protein